jgi:hypothetical protein
MFTDATLHEATVQAVARGDAPSWRRRRGGLNPHPVSDVTVTRVHPLVWAEAMRRAGGDAKRIEVLSATSVIVR